MLKHRWIPLTWAAIDLGIAAALFLLWRPHAYSLLWWVRDVAGGVTFLMAVQSLYFGLFAPRARIRRLVNGDFSKPGPRA
jgi:hypothetical protein